VICTKVRDGAKRIVRLKEGEPQGRHVVIVDDLVQSGGTLIECHALLSSLGAKHGARGLRGGQGGRRAGAERGACCSGEEHGGSWHEAPGDKSGRCVGPVPARIAHRAVTPLGEQPRPAPGAPPPSWRRGRAGRRRTGAGERPAQRRGTAGAPPPPPTSAPLGPARAQPRREPPHTLPATPRPLSFRRPAPSTRPHPRASPPPTHPTPPRPKVSAYVTHGVFPRESWNKFKADDGAGAAANGGFRYFWLSDSCPQTTRAVEGRQPFEVLTLAGPIAAALQI
jgi:hypothetical protein